MFYHTKDYMDIASSEMRAARFRHEVENVTPGNALNDAKRDHSPTEPRTNHSTPGTGDAMISKAKRDHSPTEPRTNHSTPGTGDAMISKAKYQRELVWQRQFFETVMLDPEQQATLA
eukprot:1079714_1